MATRIKNFLASAKVLVALAVLIGVMGFISCTEDASFGGELKKSTSVDTVIKPVEKEWELVRLDTTTVDSHFFYTLVVKEKVTGETHTMRGRTVFTRMRTNYQILADKEKLSPEFSNSRYTGGATAKEPNDSGYIAVTAYYWPTEDDNVLVMRDTCERLNGVPGLSIDGSKIMSLVDPTLSTRALYKVKDAPIVATDLNTYRSEGLVLDFRFDKALSTDFNRYLMAENDIADVKEVGHGFEVLDATTDRCWLKELFIMKDGSKNEIEKTFLRQRLFEGIPSYRKDVKSFAYVLGEPLGLTPLEPEEAKKDRWTDDWSVWGKKDMSSTPVNGEPTINTKYTYYTERCVYKDKWIEVEFPYVIPEVAEDETTVKTVASDETGKDKAILTNSISTDYAGYAQPLSEYVLLYKDGKVEEKLEDEGWDEKSAKKDFTKTTETVRIDWVKKFTAHEERIPFVRTFQRELKALSDFNKEAKDASQNTGRPSTRDIKKTEKEAKADTEGGIWTWVEEIPEFGSDVRLNGADAENLWQSTEANEIKITYKGETYSFGQDGYETTNTASVGVGKEVNGYTEYPYSAVLNYKFGKADVKTCPAPGTIKVKVAEPEPEETFFPGKIVAVYQTTTETEKHDGFSHVLSIHLVKDDGTYCVLPVLFPDAATAPVWDFTLLEENASEKYNSAAYNRGKGKWINAVASDEKDYLLWAGPTRRSLNNVDYLKAKELHWDRDFKKDGHLTVFTERFDIQIKNGTLFLKDRYNGNQPVTDSHTNKDGGWK